MNEDSTHIGYVTSVEGAKVTGVLRADAGGGDSIGIGDLVKIRTPRSLAIGMVRGLFINAPSSPPRAEDRRSVDLELIGETMSEDEGEGSFQRGVSIYPPLGETIHTATSADLAKIYARPRSANIRIGTIRQDESIPAYLAVDDLLSRHFALIGSTGAGKSCAVAAVTHSMLASHPSGHIVILDPHDEYVHAFGDAAHVVAPSNLVLPYWLLNLEEVSEVLCGKDPVERQAEMMILKDAIVTAKQEYAGAAGTSTKITVDTPVPYQLGRVRKLISAAAGSLSRPEAATLYFRLIAKIESLQEDKRFAFMFSGVAIEDNMAEVLSNILRIPVEGQPVTIFTLSGVPSEIVDVVVSLLCRLIFDFAIYSPGHGQVPVLLLCEEAHRYIPRDESMGFGPSRRAIARIAKEGRKYGISLGLVSQRPSELSETILSQCNTLFALRLTNDADQQYVRHALPEHAAGLLDALPVLRNRESVVVGEGVSFPMIVRFDYLAPELRPGTGTAGISAAWRAGAEGREYIHDTVERWRGRVR